MNSKRPVSLLVSAALLFVLAVMARASGLKEDCGSVETICTLVPKFSVTGRETAATHAEPETLGLNVSTVLYLQFFRTLVAQRGDDDFGSGAVTWSDYTIDPPSHAEAEAIPDDLCIRDEGEVGCNAILWGRVSPYGNAALVTASLTIPDHFPVPVWEVAISGVSFEQPIPSRRYNFSPIVLTPSQLQTYSSPEHLRIWVGDDSYAIDGAIRALRHIDGERSWVRVIESGLEGEMEFDELGERGNAVNFTAGVIRVMRGDWQGAVDTFRPLALSQESPAEVKIDANWYLAFAESQLSRNAAAQIRRARNAYPYSSTLAKGLVMAELAALSQGASEGNASVASAMNDYCRQFGSNDAWIRDAIQKGNLVGIDDVALPDCGSA